MVNSSIGQIYTPSFIAKFMVLNIIHHLKNSSNATKDQLKINDMSVLEPSVGEGVFLKYLLDYGFTDITAYETDSSLKEKLTHLYPHLKIHFENILKLIPREKFDIIIGNPPYLGHNYNSKIFQDYIAQSSLCKKYFVGNMDLFYYFIHLGMNLLKPGGLLSFITTNYWVGKSEKTGIKHLKPHIIDECYLVEYIDLSKLNLFQNAQGQHNCIFTLQKKTKEEKTLKLDRKIKIIQVNSNPNPDIWTDFEYNDKVFKALINIKKSKWFKSYFSATTNKDLKGNKSWNLLNPAEIKEIVDKIETYCMRDGNISFLKDIFIIRNGLIFIKDDIFILKEDKDIFHKNGSVFVKINKDFAELTKNEQKKLKRLYKSSSIETYGYTKNKFEGYAIFFNRKKINEDKIEDIEKYYQEKYPTISEYLKQKKDQLIEILKNAGENPSHYFFPRRGDRIKRRTEEGIYELIYLEDHYEAAKKIFFPYITDTNTFGYSDESFFATSDTYFLWPKISEDGIDYKFLLSYLNSEIVQFLFHAKGIKIKRSKTKLENSLPIPNLNLPIFKNKTQQISFVKFLSGLIIELKKRKLEFDIKKYLLKLKEIKNFATPNKKSEVEILQGLIEERNEEEIMEYVNTLFYDLFDLDEKNVKALIEEYY